MATHGEGLFLPLPQRGGIPAFHNFWVPFYSCIHPLMQNYQISCDNTYGEGACLPHPKGVGSPPSPNFCLSIYAYTKCRRNTKSDTFHVGTRGPCILGQPRFLSKENGVSALPTFGSSPVKPVIMPPPFNTERLNLHGNTYGKGWAFLGQPRHCSCTNASCGLLAIAEFLVKVLSK